MVNANKIAETIADVYCKQWREMTRNQRETVIRAETLAVASRDAVRLGMTVSDFSSEIANVAPIVRCALAIDYRMPV